MTRSHLKLFGLGLIGVVPAVLVLLVARAVLAAGPAASAVPIAPEVVRWGFASAAAAAGLSAVGAAYAVAVVGGAAMGVIAEKPEMAGRAIVFVGLAEGIAIYGLIIAIMILGRLG